MSELDRLFGEYVERHRAGAGPDPDAYLAKVAGRDRAELRALIEGHLAGAPRRAWDPEAFERSIAKPAVEALARALEGESGLWPAILPRLRSRAGLEPGELTERLAAELGVTDASKVGRYYGEMEAGTLAATGVSERVLAALGRLLGQSADALRQAGQALAGGPEAMVMARRTGDAWMARSVPGDESAGGADEIDRLFLEG